MSDFNKPTNPPAFPNSYYSNVYGMTLRDYFAAKAMAAILVADVDLDWADDVNTLASASYGYADAMLRVRQEGWEPEE